MKVSPHLATLEPFLPILLIPNLLSWLSPHAISLPEHNREAYIKELIQMFTLNFETHGIQRQIYEVSWYIPAIAVVVQLD